MFSFFSSLHEKRSPKRNMSYMTGMRGTCNAGRACLALCIFIFLSLVLCSCSLNGANFKANDKKVLNDENSPLSVVAVNFPAYDFARAVCGYENVYMLLPPGGDSHSYEPTAKDILRISECDLFIYTGGESDAWVERVLSSLDHDVNTLKMMDIVPLIAIHDNHGEPDSHSEHSHSERIEYDEHVWTSPVNAALITGAIKDRLCDICTEKGKDINLISKYEKNACEYIEQIDKIDSEFRRFFENAPDRPLIFGDRFPIIYFTEEYKLRYYAAFPGCAEHSEPGAHEIAQLIEIIRRENASVIYCIEFSDRNIAESLAEAAGGTDTISVQTFYTCHNVSKEQFEAGETYITLMTKNLETLRAYLR